MRLAVFVLSPLVLATMLLFTSVAAVVGEDRSEAAPSRDVRPEWYSLAKGRTEFEVSDPALVLSQLALAAKESNCSYELEIKQVPIRFVILRDRRFAIVFCSAGAHPWNQLFDLSGPNLEKPKLVQLPLLEHPDGFGATSTPLGEITWKSGKGVLQVEVGSDISFAKLRHTYRLGYSAVSFVVVRVEYRCNECGKDEWTTIWDAPQWSFSTKEK